MTATYKKVRPAPPPPTVKQADCTVNAADGFNVTAGLGTDVSNQANVIVQYQVTSGGTPVGGYTGGTAQEKITAKSDWQGNPIPDDQDWSPASPSSQFYLSHGVIYDSKGVLMDQQTWNAIPVGTVFYKFTQSNRIIWLDGNNPPLVNEEPLGSVKLQRRKTSTSSWCVDRQ